MIFLILAIISSALVSIIMRLSTGKVSGNIGMLAANYLTCITAALFYTENFSVLPSSVHLSKTLFMGGINGFLYLASFVFFQYCVKNSGVVLSSVFMKLGMLLPLVVSVAFFGEIPTFLQVVGFILATAAIIMVNYKSDKSKNGRFASLILLLLLSGGAEGMSKVFKEVGDASLSSQFLLYTFFSAFILSLVLMLSKKQRLGKSELFYGFLIGIPNFFSAKFVLRALSEIPAIIVFPSFAVATILTVSLVGILAFKEKLTRLQWAAVGIIIVTLAVLNI